MNTSEIKTNFREIVNSIYNHNKYVGVKLFLTTEIINQKTIFPPPHLRCNAFNWFNWEDTKVIIVGQDPYHGENQANGLCFSVNTGEKIPPSLKNIFREISNEFPDFDYVNHTDGNLEYLAKQGVLLLNTSFTVEKGKPNSHEKAWRGFTRDLISYILQKKKLGVVLLLWGRNAQKCVRNLNLNGHHILRATHPSPLGANKGGWFKCNHFIKTNEILKSLGKKPIDWVPKK